jgi:ribosomal protein S12 methylthiotransferase accessory factor YcaO
MIKSEIRSAQALMAKKMPSLYRELKYVCLKQGLPIRRAMREAIQIWLKKEIEREDIDRQNVIIDDLKKIKKTLFYLKDCCNEANDNNYTHQFKKIYDKIIEILETI